MYSTNTRKKRAWKYSKTRESTFCRQYRSYLSYKALHTYNCISQITADIISLFDRGKTTNVNFELLFTQLFFHFRTLNSSRDVNVGVHVIQNIQIALLCSTRKRREQKYTSSRHDFNYPRKKERKLPGWKSLGSANEDNGTAAMTSRVTKAETRAVPRERLRKTGTAWRSALKARLT